jgi:hypothetical protein
MQKVIIKSSIIAAASAISMDLVASPDVFGPNGANYTNTSPD